MTSIFNYCLVKGPTSSLSAGPKRGPRSNGLRTWIAVVAIAMSVGVFIPQAQTTDHLLAPAEQRAGAAALRWSQKLTCGTTEAGVTRYGMWEGKLYSRSPGEKDRHVFNVVGINVRQCEAHEDAERGEGFRSVSREIMVYLDPITDTVIDAWRNPWTGATVEVIHVANDPVNMRSPTFERKADGTPLTVSLRRYQDTLVSSREIPLFYTNPLGGDYQQYVGGTYHAMEIFNTYYRAEDFLDERRTRIGESRISWQRISSWLPWMQMGDRPGIMIFNATGYSTFDRERIPERLLTVLNARFPEYLQAPALGDPRPNETTWTVTKKIIDAQRRVGSTGGSTP